METGTAIFIGIALSSIILSFITFLVLGILAKNNGVKIFSLGFASILLVGLFGTIMSIMENEFVGEFAQFQTIYYYIYNLFLILAGVGAIGLIVWFIYFALTTFSKLRGREVEDD